jgi:two-component system, LytTR family, response regulator LytT
MPTAIIADDEEHLADYLAAQLAHAWPELRVLAVAHSGPEAAAAIATHRPDVAFLDIRMPGATGLEVAQQLGAAQPRPHVVFVTAYDQYAVEAFDAGAADYLLKPVEAERLGTTVDRVRRRIHNDRSAAAPPSGPGDLERLLRLIDRRQEHREQLAIRAGDRFLLVQSDEIVHISVEDDVITVVTNSLSGTSNYRTLDELQARLDPAVFWRVHRSHLVNINRIKEIVPWFSRNFMLRMKDAKGTEIPVSRSQTKRLREYLRL